MSFACNPNAVGWDSEDQYTDCTDAIAMCAALYANNPPILLDDDATDALDGLLKRIGDGCTGVLRYLRTNNDPETEAPYANNYQPDAIATMQGACAALSGLADAYEDEQSNSLQAQASLAQVCWVLSNISVYDPMNEGYAKPVVPGSMQMAN
jgi:hypothetical protein